ncbi:MAG: methylated-DNA--[protein]-cysteine S-methyltransferase [Betaproteobacteria bacterium]
MPTPFAALGIITDDAALTGIDFLPLGTPALAPQNPVAELACAQLRAYLADPSFRFDLPLSFAGTPFQIKVWQALRGIPSGATRHYGELAHLLGTAPRAVGQACGANLIPVVIPCHRVLARSGLGGFMNSAGGDPLAIKRWLLQHESGQSRSA